MTDYVLPAALRPSVAIVGDERRFAVHRIYCVGRNYADHVREMGNDPVRTAPLFFSKPADAIVADGVDIPYASMTTNLHYEAELVVAIGRGGRRIDREVALDHVYGYAVGNDYTRRDLQAAAQGSGQPWDTAKGFDHSAAIGAIYPVARVGHPARGRIALTLNGVERQAADLGDMIWDVPGIIEQLSRFFALAAGDLIYTGTPAGVGAVAPGDIVSAEITGLGAVTNRIVAPL
jgi:fumarylpyruvate hydrolase